MKLKEALQRLDQSEKNSDWVNLELFAQEFNIHQYLEEPSEIPIKCYFIGHWYCTDSYVGYRAYFMNQELICISSQMGRKMNQKFEWVSREAYLQTFNYLTSLIKSNLPEPKIIDLQEEIADGMKISYGSQLLTDQIIYQPTNEMVTVLERYQGYQDIDKWSLVKVLRQGNEEIVDLKDILVPYNII